MQFIQERETQNSLNRMKVLNEDIEQVPMHPDDFSALLEWVTAKRFHELVLKKTFAEVPAYYRFPG